MMSWLAIAGGLLIALLAVQHPEDLRQLGNGFGTTLFAAALAFGAIVVPSVAHYSARIKASVLERICSPEVRP
jgi:hypothetical protein